MKKRILVALAVALLAVVLVASPIFASGVHVEINVSAPTVTGDNQQGGTAVASGVVTVHAWSSDTSGSPKSAYAEGEAGYSITAPDGTPLFSGTQSNSVWDFNQWGWQGNANADVTINYNWSQAVELNQIGEYLIANYGEGYANYLAGNFHWTYVVSDSDGDSKVIVWEVSPRVTQFAPPCWYPIPTQFSIWCGGVHSFDWVDGNDRSILPAINLVTTARYNGTETTLKFVIPEGTVVTGDYCVKVLAPPDKLNITTLNGGHMTFSNPLVISELINGEWVEIISITSL